MITPIDLTCEYRVDPLGLDVQRPRLGWKLPVEGNRRGVLQRAYRIRAATTPEAARGDGGDLLWDSGRVDDDRNTQIEYSGPPLPSRGRACWTVQVWTNVEDGPGPVSVVASWESGLLARSDWEGAQWIGAPWLGGPRTCSPSPFLRREFSLDQDAGQIASARLYVTAFGVYEFYLNGQRVGDDVFSPGWTDYHQRVQYQAYDVAALLRAEQNAAGAILGDGWYCGHIAGNNRQSYGDRPWLLALLAITFADDSIQTLITDANWQTAAGPILESDFLMGESYDARREIPGWCEPSSAETSLAGHWFPVEIREDNGARRVAQGGPTVRRMETIVPPKPPVEAPPGLGWVWPGKIVDLGQNMTGTVRLKVRAERGATLRLRYAETLDDKGALYVTNLRGARATDHYTCRGGGEVEIWEPHFTFHGFRYVEICSGAGFELAPDGVTGLVLYSDTPATGQFECSDGFVNQLQNNIQWGQKGNFLDVPTDCPQRDERLGWAGDAQVFIRTAAFNAQVAGFFTKWQDDIADTQHHDGAVPCTVPNQHAWPEADPYSNNHNGGPAWADAVIICPWTVYLCYGDTRLLANHYDSMRRYVDYLEATSRDGIRCRADGPDFEGFGDWLAWDGSGKNEGGTPKPLIGTAFYAYSTRLLARIARVLGKETDAARYHRQTDEIRTAFQREFVTPDGHVAGNTQTAYVLALHFDLLPEDLRATAAELLVADIRSRGMHLATGFVGTPYLMPVLTAAGKLDTAYELLQQKTWPSWLYAVTQGATTIWERWNGWTHDEGFADPTMNSFNHYAYGAVGEWLYATVGGIDLDPEHPGYRHIVLRPKPGNGLTHARAALDTLQGRVTSAWSMDAHGTFEWHIAVPPNATATAWLPARAGTKVTEGGCSVEHAEGVEFIRDEKGASVCRLGSGNYHFKSTN